MGGVIASDWVKDELTRAVFVALLGIWPHEANRKVWICRLHLDPLGQHDGGQQAY